MFSLTSSQRYLLYQGDCDMRRGAYSLSGLVRSELGRDPLSGEVFVFLVSTQATAYWLLHILMYKVLGQKEVVLTGFGVQDVLEDVF